MEMKCRLFVVVRALARVDPHTKLAFEVVEGRKLVTAGAGAWKIVAGCWVFAGEH